MSAIASHLANCSTCQQRFETCGDSPLGDLLEQVDSQLMSTFIVPSAAPDIPKPLKDVPPPSALVDHPDWQSLNALGTAGTVYLVRHRHLRDHDGGDRLRVLKIVQIHPRPGQECLEHLTCVLGAVVRVTEHPHCVRVYGVEQFGAVLLVEMEYIAGQNLEEYAKSFSTHSHKSGRIPTALACGYVLQALFGLEHAQQHGLALRNLAPENLMLTYDQTIKILDLGLPTIEAHGTPNNRPSPTPDQPAECPNEFAADTAQESSPAGLQPAFYNLGCTLLRLIAGSPPIASCGASGELVDVPGRQGTRRLPSLREVCPGSSVEVSDVIDRLLEARPNLCFESPIEAARALFPHADGFAQRLTRKWVHGSPPTAVTTCIPTRRIRLGQVFATLLLVALIASLWVVPWQAIVQIRTKIGIVELEVDDPNVEIRIDDRPIKATQIRVRTKGSKSWLSIDAQSGQRELRLSKPGFEVVTAHAEVRDGKSTPVRVLLKPLPPPEKTTQPVLKYTTILDAEYAANWAKSGAEKTDLSYHDDVLTALNTGSEGWEDHLFTRRDNFRNLRLRYEVNMEDVNSPSIVMFRVQPSTMIFGGMRGYQVVLRPKSELQPGTIELDLGNRARTDLQLKKVVADSIIANRWISIEIIAEDWQVQVLLDGKPALNYRDEGLTFDRGCLALRFLSKACLQYRNIGLHELAESPATKAPRSRWSFSQPDGNEWNETWGTFAKTGEKSWLQTVTFPTAFHRFEFKETLRTDEFIEIQQVAKNGQVFRLFNNRLVFSPNAKGITEILRGSWDLP